MVRSRWLTAGLVVGFLVVAFGGFVLWHRKTYHEWPGAPFPDRLDHCDRSYGRGDRISAKEAPQPLRLDFRFEPELAAHHDVYLEPDKLFTNAPGEQCPMAYFMKDGSSYVVYGLLGGP